MTAALLISGFIQVLVPHALVKRWLGKSAGIKGVFVATGVGALTPGGPMLAFPLVIVLRNASFAGIADYVPHVMGDAGISSRADVGVALARTELRSRALSGVDPAALRGGSHRPGMRGRR